MERLTYIVGKEEIASYVAAKARSEETGLPMKPKYNLIVEEQRADPVRLAKIQKHFAEMRARRA